jgi:DNA (cytosine-5)-methyltransferase 1
MTNKTTKYNVLDLFCGCGGMSLGFENAGFNILLGIDVWEDALVTYQLNHKDSKVLCSDLSTLQPELVKKTIEGQHVDVIIGGPPCQGFSVAGKRIVDDERNKLYKSFVRMVEYFKPKAFVLENVPNILSIGDGIVKDAIVSDFQNLGYNVVYKILTASDYGVPQNRRRAIFVGSLSGKEYEFPKPFDTAKVTSKEAISDLPEYGLDDGADYPCAPNSEYQRIMRQSSRKLYNHQVTIHNQKTTDIISLVPDGGNYKDLPLELQNTRKVHIAWTRLNSNRPSFTIDCGHNHHFHYLYNRVPTVRESARIQSFPDNYIIIGNKGSQLKQVGNAVPPLMSLQIANNIKALL